MNPNPKTPQDLDPKLKEAYDRIMGGNFNSVSPTSNVSEVPKTETSAPVTADPIIPPATILTRPLKPFPVGIPSPSEQPITPVKKKSKISPIVFLIIGFFFFAIYIVVWGKIFKLF